MTKLEMRDWMIALESIIDNKLNRWKKESRIENGEAVQVQWQFEQTHILIDVFWEDDKEAVRMRYLSPRTDHNYHWNGLSDQTFNRVMDRVGNLAQVTMNPPIEPRESE